jgi:hypothetical protein
MKQRLWRYGSPSTLLFALLLFPLPWIEIQCPNFMTGKNDICHPSKSASAPQPAEKSSQPDPPDWMNGILFNLFGPRKSVLISQSGIQAIGGWWSYGGDIDEDKPQALRLRREMDAGMTAAPVLGVYFGVLLLGCATAFLMKPGLLRSSIVAGTAAVTLGLIVMQLWIGFPLDEAFCRVPWRTVLEDPSQFKGNRASLREDIGCTAWFWMAQGSLVLALLLQPAEWWCVYRRAREAPPGPADDPSASVTAPTSSSFS